MISGGAATPLAQLQARFGEALISTEPASLAAAGVDHRRLYHGKPLAIALPRSTLEVSQLLAFCDARGIGVVPQGGNTGLVGGATPASAQNGLRSPIPWAQWRMASRPATSM